MVKSELADEVHLHGYDLSADVAPGEPATIRFKATCSRPLRGRAREPQPADRRARGSPLTLLAHGIGGVRDLPVPALALLLWAAAVVLILSFLALGALWKSPQLERRRVGHPLPAGLERFLRSPVLHGILGAISAGLLVLIFLTALIGEPSSAQNLTPTFIYVIFWLGLVPVQVLFGNVWRVLNPWLALANGVEWVWRKLGQDWKPPLEYPERLGRVAGARSSSSASRRWSSATPSPRARARWRSRSRSTATRCGSAWPPTGGGSGTRTGTASPSTSACSRGSRRSVSTRAGSCCGCRFSGLSGRETTPGVLAFVAVMLGSVGFDGLSRASFWQNLRARVEGPYIVDAARPRGALLDGARAGRPARLRAPRRARLPRRRACGASEA